MNATRTILQIDEVIGLIKQNYSNLDIREVKLYARGINEYYTVLAKDKPSTNQDEQRFFLRISPADRLVDFSREHYSTEVNLINHLNSHNFPTVEIVPRIDGKGLGEIKKNTGSIYYILFKELVGTPLIEKGLSGKQLATFHIITSELSDLHRPECGTQFLVEYLGPQIQKFLVNRPGDWAVVEKILIKIPDILNNARDKEYPHGLIHGDFQGNNILVKDDKIIIFDFDYSFKGFQIMDIA
ncbi:MAG: phosphotransferase, partial [Candidatus Hodarchaeales archaeon]